MDAPDELRVKLRRQRVKVVSGRYIIPDCVLPTIIDENTVDAVLAKCSIAVHKRSEIASAIVDGGKKVFAILILGGQQRLVSKFLEHDGLQKTDIDSKLPFNLPQLCSIFGNNDAADTFFELQWELVSPIFGNDRSHRMLHEDSILPIVRETFLSKGGFGDVYAIQLVETHQEIWTRRMGTPQSPLSNPVAEDEILSLLRGLRHPNISRLLGSYSYKGIYNMLFPLAEYDLERFLAEPVPARFREEKFRSEALLGLSSAIEALHNYFCQDYSLDLIGCHYDLRPKYILVDGEKFLLSDFGLSRLKNPQEDSKSIFKAAVGDCVAPECYADEASFRKGSIGRASDIWSFGCILLLVTTHAKEGPSGVDTFDNRRKVTISTELGPLTHRQFHRSGRLNPAVEEQISRQKSDDPLLTILAEDMLNTDPKKRPGSREVSQRLFFVVTKCLCRSIRGKFDQLIALSKTASAELELESERFRSWTKTICPEPSKQSAKYSTDLFRLGMEPLRSLLVALNDLENELQYLLSNSDGRQFLRPIYTPLRHTLTLLWNHVSLSHETKEKMRADWTNRVLDSEDDAILKDRHDALLEDDGSNAICMLTAMKYMTSLMQQGRGPTTKALAFESNAVSIEEDRADFSLGTIRHTGQRVLIERLRYRPFWIRQGEKDIGGELFDRVGAIAEILSMRRKPIELRTLECLGYYHDQPLQSFSLMFALSDHSTPQEFSKALLESKNPTSLHAILQTYRTPTNRPPLGDVFKLAHALATSLLAYHRIGWLHKDICSFNVIFLLPYTKSASIAPIVTSPYLIGFKHSRQDEVEAFSTGSQRREGRRLHLHPDYRPPAAEHEEEGHLVAAQSQPERYRLEFDYYSFGLMLLELGLWYTLKDIDGRLQKAGKGALYTTEGRLELLRRIVPSLGCAAGLLFQDAVSFCLDGSHWECIRHNKHMTFTAFEEGVIKPLGLCRA